MRVIERRRGWLACRSDRRATRREYHDRRREQLDHHQGRTLEGKTALPDVNEPLDALASPQFGRRHRFARPELRAVARELLPDERVLSLVLATSKGRCRAVAATDQRLLVTRKPPFQARRVEVFPYPQLDSVELVDRHRRPALRLSSGGRRVTLTVVALGELAEVLAEKIGDRLRYEDPDDDPVGAFPAVEPPGEPAPATGASAPPRVPQPIPRSPGFSVIASLRAEPLRYALSADSTEFAWLLLRARADALDRGGAYRVVTAAGAFDLWIASRKGSWVGVAAAPGADEALAGYYPSWRPGGTLVVRDHRYRLWKQWSVGWALRDGRGVIARLDQPAESLYAGDVRVKLGRAAQEIPDCDLVLTLGVWAVMLERVALSGAGR